MNNFGDSMLSYWAAYFIVTFIGVIHTIYNAKVKHMGVMTKERVPMNQIESYARTMPFHWLYNLLIFPIFAWLYLRGLESINFNTALITGLIWGAITIVFDLIGWVLIPHPWQCTFKDFYIDYQPWITIIYLVITCSPFIAYGIMHFL